MEQGTRLDSTPVSVAQAVRDDVGPDRTLDAAVAAILTVTSAKTTVIEPDPILAAIAETRRLMLARHAAADLPQPAGSIDTLPEQNAATDAFFAHVDNVLLKTIPNTAAGCAALARYTVEFLETEGFALDEDQSNEQHVRILDLIARSPLSASAIPSASDLATACVDQIKRLEQWDENPDAVSQKQGDEEMYRWGAVFRRAIDEPSASLSDLAGKAYLMLADLDRFMPQTAEQYQYDNYRLMRVIMREVVAMGGLTYTAPARANCQDEAAIERIGGDTAPTLQAASVEDRSNELTDQYAVMRAVQRHREAKQALDVASLAADELQIRNDDGDTSKAALELLNTRWTTASNAYDQAYRDLIVTRPQTLHDCLTLLRHLAEHADGHRGMEDEPDVFGALIGALEGMQLSGIIPAAGHDLSHLSIAELETLARIGRQEHEMLMAIEQTPICYDETASRTTLLGQIIEIESNRFGFLADHAVSEIARRRPTNRNDANLRLDAMIRHHLTCNGYIEPTLMTEVVQAWGRA